MRRIFRFPHTQYTCIYKVTNSKPIRYIISDNIGAPMPYAIWRFQKRTKLTKVAIGIAIAVCVHAG